jgi:hypothetical protein
MLRNFLCHGGFTTPFRIRCPSSFWGMRWQQVLLSADDEDVVVVDNGEFYLEENCMSQHMCAVMGAR